MSFTTTTLKPVTKPVSEKPVNTDLSAPLLTLLLLSVYAARKSRKAMRKMKRRLLWKAFKWKLRSMFSGSISDRTLIYILLGVVLLALLLIEPVLVLLLVLVLLILILADVIQV